MVPISDVNPYVSLSLTHTHSHSLVCVLQVVPISDVNPYGRHTIRGRVITKDEMRSWNKNGTEKKVFSVTIMDDTMDIKATFWDDVATRFYDVLQVTLEMVLADLLGPEGKSNPLSTRSGSTLALETISYRNT